MKMNKEKTLKILSIILATIIIVVLVVVIINYFKKDERSMVTEGIPNKKLLTSGERTAVNIPTLNPYL